jgi:hypothetical protein
MDPDPDPGGSKHTDPMDPQHWEGMLLFCCCVEIPVGIVQLQYVIPRKSDSFLCLKSGLV